MPVGQYAAQGKLILPVTTPVVHCHEAAASATQAFEPPRTGRLPNNVEVPEEGLYSWLFYWGSQAVLFQPAKSSQLLVPYSIMQ